MQDKFFALLLGTMRSLYHQLLILSALLVLSLHVLRKRTQTRDNVFSRKKSWIEFAAKASKWKQVNCFGSQVSLPGSRPLPKSVEERDAMRCQLHASINRWMQKQRSARYKKSILTLERNMRFKCSFRFRIITEY